MACFLVHSLAVLSNLPLSSAKSLATSGRVGRGEQRVGRVVQGEASREWRESSTRAMELLSDHCDRKINPPQASLVSNFLAEEPFFGLLLDLNGLLGANMFGW